MRIGLILLIISAVLVLHGCATNSQGRARGGSSSDPSSDKCRQYCLESDDRGKCLEFQETVKSLCEKDEG